MWLTVQNGTMIILLSCFFLPIIAHSAFFDPVVRAEYRDHQAAWLADGRPRGWFWRAPAHETMFDGISARTRTSWEWFRKTPGWATQSGQPIRNYLLFFRASLISWLPLMLLAYLLIDRGVAV